ncbi:MAG: hypothetical protein M9897_10325 [Brumimicrobium sp.]|nr:hypothetical protein [Brumimicrobium sp.]
MYKTLTTIFFLFILNISCSQCVGTLILNEFSNGASGSKEYFEYIVGGPCDCERVDVRGWIMDDNNGEFGTGTGVGIASGFVMLDSISTWSNVKLGSIIVIYNNNDVNDAISTLFTNNAGLVSNDALIITDSLYVLPLGKASSPITSNLLKVYSTQPSTSNPLYNVRVPFSGAQDRWGTIALANVNDAVQSRYPDGSYYFGVSYGSAMTVGPDNTKLSGSTMANKNGYFSAGNFRDITNWSIGSYTSDTPGQANNANNQLWIDSVRSASLVCQTVLPVELVSFSVVQEEEFSHISWVTESEHNCDYFVLYHAYNSSFIPIDTIQGAGNSLEENRYDFQYKLRGNGVHYFKLKQVDFDGKEEEFNIISLLIDRQDVRYHIASKMLLLPTNEQYVVYSLQGSKVLEASDDVYFDKQGFFYVQNQTTMEITRIFVP